MEKKDLSLGILLIVIVGLSGGLGYVLLMGPTLFGTSPEEQQLEEVNLFGLPDEWNTAPNASYFMLYNQTGVSIKVTLKDILDGVNLALEEQAAGGPAINDYKKVMYPYTFQDPISGLYITGVDLLDVLEKYDTNFGWDLELVSGYGHEMEITTGDIINNMYEGDENSIIIAIAANKTWLAESPVGPQWGNFSFVGELLPSAIYDLQQVNVNSNWTVEVVVNGTTEYIIDPSNMAYNGYDDTYHYDRDDWWNFNRHYWGRNISEIISHTSAEGLNYSVRAWSVDGWANPRPFGKKKEVAYNNTDVEIGIVPPYPELSDTNDLINSSEVPLPQTNLLMALVHTDQEFGETGQNITDPIWPYNRVCGYHRGPFYLIVPNRPRDNFLSHVTRIEITVYTD
ncbi:MAG: hypothetical protein ACTSWY_08200 [Promethearchaeota archaeon]